MTGKKRTFSKLEYFLCPKTELARFWDSHSTFIVSSTPLLLLYKAKSFLMNLALFEKMHLHSLQNCIFKNSQNLLFKLHGNSKRMCLHCQRKSYSIMQSIAKENKTGSVPTEHQIEKADCKKAKVRWGWCLMLG